VVDLVGVEGISLVQLAVFTIASSSLFHQAAEAIGDRRLHRLASIWLEPWP
jgi:hypothetical protein